MKVLGISGSPSRKGVTSALLDEALRGARSKGAVTEKVVLNDLDFRPCQECGGCSDTGICVLKDGFSQVYEKLMSADSVIIASPVFFGTISAQLKMMIDRLQCVWVAKHVLKKKPAVRARKGVFFSASGHDRPEFFENSARIIRILFKVLDINYSGDLFLPAADKAEGAGRRVEALEKAFQMGAGLVR